MFALQAIFSILQLALCTAGSHDGSVVLDEMQNLILGGKISHARRLANKCIGKLGHFNPHQIISSVDEACPPTEEILKVYKEYATLFYKNENFLQLIKDSLHEYKNNNNDDDDSNDALLNSLQSFSCWNGQISNSQNSPFELGLGYPGSTQGSISIQRWNDCCSFSYTHEKKPTTCYSADGKSHLCCDFSVGTENHLVLPALKEPFVTIRLEHQFIEPMKYQTIEIEQEGQLDMYDVSGVLWPAGYLLGLCLYDPVTCGVPELINVAQHSGGFPTALELGTGVGFPSIVFAKSMSRHLASSHSDTCENHGSCPASKGAPVVVATDSSRLSLGLTVSNAYRNGVHRFVNVSEVDHMSIDSLSNLRLKFYSSGGGFDLIFGSSLQGFFDGTSQPDAILWRSLDLLLSKTNPDAIILLSHVRTGNERIEVPIEPERGDHQVNSFEILRRISGDVFNILTRDGNSSDFELVVLRRRN